MGTSDDDEVAAGRDAANEQILEIDGFEADSIDADHVDTTAHPHVPAYASLPARSYAIEDDGDGGWFTMG